MKKVFLFIFISFISILSIILVLFLKPELVVNQKNLEWALKRWSSLDYTFESFEFKHEKLSLLERNIDLKIENLKVSTPQDSNNGVKEEFSAHLEQMELSFRLFWRKQWQIESKELNQIKFKNIAYVMPKKSKDENNKKPLPFHIAKNYGLLWQKVIPDFDLIIDQFEIKKQNATYQFPIHVKHRFDQLEAHLYELKMIASRKKINIFVKNPKDLWSLTTAKEYPKNWKEVEMELSLKIEDDLHPLELKINAFSGTVHLETMIPESLEFEKIDLILEALISTLKVQLEMNQLTESSIPMLDQPMVDLMRGQDIHANIKSILVGKKKMSGTVAIEMVSQIEVTADAMKFTVNHMTEADFETKALLRAEDSLLRQLALGTQLDLNIDQLKQKWSFFESHLFQLPAPLNSLDGHLNFHLGFRQRDDQMIEAVFDIAVDLKGHQQNLILQTQSILPLDIATLKLQGTLQNQIELKHVNIRLPQWRAQANTPQFLPDSRIILNTPKENIKTTKKPRMQVNLHLKTEKNHPVTIATNLLKKRLEIIFDLQIKQGIIETGWLEILPLDLEVFKRKIVLKKLTIKFQEPLVPQLMAELHFHLPQYLIVLKLEGTTAQIRHHFSSTPPLPQSDIFAVLLFGRPLTELSQNDREATNQTQQLLSDGLLSLSVLYFLSGGPIESIGFNPETGSVSAQLGISQKSSLTVSTSASGENNASIRRNLGKGWSINTSVQNSTQLPHGTQQDYGVLLEKIMAY